MSDRNRYDWIENVGGFDDQICDAEFIRAEDAGVKPHHEKNEQFGTERADRENQGIAEQASVLIHSGTLSQAKCVDTVSRAVGQPCTDQAAQDTDQQTGKHICGIMHTGIQTGESD